MGMKHSPDFGPDYRWNSYVPHLLEGHDARGYPHRLCPLKEYRNRRPSEIRTPLVRALALHDVSGIPEATWAQPLSREELS